MKVLILNDNSGPKYHRLYLPCFLMPGIELIVGPLSLEENLCKDVDIVFVNRGINNAAIMDIELLRKRYGFKLVVDFDDHWFLDPDHILFDQYRHTKASYAMMAYIEMADAVTVTHERLADEVREINPNVCILPNAIPKVAQFLCTKQPDELTRLFWAGGNTHEKDIQLLFEPVKQFRELPVKMVMGGFRKLPEWYNMRNAFTRYGRMNHELLENLPIHQYYYAYSKCDIALVPLVESKFNTHKSNLKILEAANIGANVVVSNVHPYKNVPGVEYVNEPADWFTHVKNLIDNPDYAATQAAVLQEYCSEHFNFEKINKKRFELFKTLVDGNSGADTGSI